MAANTGIALYQTSSYGAAYRLIVADVRLGGLAGKAEAQAGRLDDQEAPAREIARKKKERDDGRAAAATARAANKGVFRPLLRDDRILRVMIAGLAARVSLTP
jgi:hypothetical protein